VLVVLELDVADLAATRFAISPLSETLQALHVLNNPGRAAVNWAWVRWARAELDRRPLGLPRLWPLVVTGLPYWPEFLVPAPPVRSPGIEEELARLCATPDEAVRGSLRRVFGDGPWPDSATELYERPRESFAELAAEAAEGHHRLIAPHWERIRPVLDADIAYRAERLAAGGTRLLFGDLHPGLRWSDGKLFLDDEDCTGEVTLGPDGLVLVPSVFVWPGWSIKKMTSTQTTLMYPARGIGAVWEGGTALAAPEPGTAVEALLGAPRARLLAALRSPATTGALARRFGITPSAVSQHLAVLHRGGLLDRQRSGRTVLYQASELGLALLAGAGPAGGAGMTVVRS
jgi:DNA-binding transcriptional ArsR family regulator